MDDMSTYVYIKKDDSNDSVLDQIQIINNYQVDHLFIEEDNSGSELELIRKKLVENDTLIIYSLSFIDLDRIEMCQFFQLLQTYSIHLISIKDQVDTDTIESANFISNCLVYLTSELKINRKQAVKKLTTIKDIGRPKISTHTIKRIIFLREKEKRSIRSIAEECNVSIGTVHKYVNQI